MALTTFRATNFRCLEDVSASFDARFNLITGPNAAGKTSVLEAVCYLGRGKSFRGAANDRLIRHGQGEFVLFGEVTGNGGRRTRLGVRNGRAGLETSVDGDSEAGAAGLAAALPVQVIDPDVHDLVAGGPEQRRRYLDWLGFHVEQPYLETWRRYRRALRQRNAALKAPRKDILDTWDAELLVAADPLIDMRQRVLDVAGPVVEAKATELLQASIDVELRSGWSSGISFEDALRLARDRDVRQGMTTVGPHRADLQLRYDERQAKKLVSRGQQKLLACSMLLGGTAVVQRALARPILLLIDDPAAELDRSSLGRLTAVVEELGCQVIATSLVPDISLFSVAPRLFHVEQGALTPA